MSKKEDDFYKKLKISLEESTRFPSDYMFKFIIPNNSKQEVQIKAIFDFQGATLKINASKTGKYLSVTILSKMKSADEVIEKYKEAAKVEGIISL